MRGVLLISVLGSANHAMVNPLIRLGQLNPCPVNAILKRSKIWQECFPDADIELTSLGDQSIFCLLSVSYFEHLLETKE